MAEAALILAAFVAGIAFREFWPRIIAWAEVKMRITVKPKPKPSHSPEYFEKLIDVQRHTDGHFTNPKADTCEHAFVDDDTVGRWCPKCGAAEPVISPKPPIDKPPIDKRRRGVAELRYRAEQASMKLAEHQAQVTANNIKAMES